jgi:integrase
VRDYKNGTRHYRREKAPNITVARNRRDELRQELRSDIKEGPQFTLKQFVAEYYLDRLAQKSRPSTLIRTKSCIEANILPTFGQQLLKEILPSEIENLLEVKLKHHSGQTKRHILASLRNIFKAAIILGFAKDNPALPVTRPELDRVDPLVLKEKEVKKLLQYLRENQPVMFFHAFLAVHTLARAGELRALTWADVDFERKLIHISKTCDPKTGLKNCPKNGQGRVIPINGELMQILNELRSLTFTAHSDLVLPHWREFADGEQGKPLKLILKALGLTPIRWHDLRASGITLMLTKRVPHSVIMKISGHKDIASFNIYVRLAGVEVDGETDHIQLLDDDQAEK